MSETLGEKVAEEWKKGKPAGHGLQQKVIDLIDKHGYEKVQKANEETAKKRIETGFRDIFYTIRLLQQ